MMIEMIKNLHSLGQALEFISTGRQSIQVGLNWRDDVEDSMLTLTTLTSSVLD
jgi:hypothetical protein